MFNIFVTLKFLFEKTNPKNPTAPDQKYRLTISGKMFLGNQE
jgi:hypothetical protein